MGILNLLGLGPSVDYRELMNRGAQIVDVRTRGEFAGGHIKGSLNIPLDQLSSQLSKLKKDKPVIACCASGMRSGSALRSLKAEGFEAYNGGSWSSLKSKL